MIMANTMSSINSAHLASLYMKNNGLLILTGARGPFLKPSPEMITYALSKNYVHNLNLLLSNSEEFK